MEKSEPKKLHRPRLKKLKMAVEKVGHELVQCACNVHKRTGGDFT